METFHARKSKVIVCFILVFEDGIYYLVSYKTDQSLVGSCKASGNIS